jgi:hypothetical protein
LESQNANKMERKNEIRGIVLWTIIWLWVVFFMWFGELVIQRKPNVYTRKEMRQRKKKVKKS